MGNFFGDLARTAVGVAPYAANAIAEQEARTRLENQTALTNLYQKQANDRANAMLKIAQDNSTRQAEGEWEKAEPFTQDDGSVIMAERNKRTGEYRPAQIGKPAAPGTPINAPKSNGPDISSLNDLSFASGSGTPSRSTAPALPMPGDSQDMSGEQAPQQPVASTAQAPAAPATPPAPRTLKPYVRPPLNPRPASMIPGTPEWQAAEKFKAGLRPTPQPTNVYLPTTDPTTGQTVYGVAKNKGDPTITPTNVGKPMPGGAGSLSGQTMQTLGRLGMSFNDLKQAIDQMDRYENTPGNLAKQTPLKQAIGAASEVHPSQESHGLLGAINNAAGAFVGAKAQEKLGQDDPDYRTYLNNKQRVATAFTELLPRPNQQLLQLEKGLSGQDVGWNPELVKNIQARRRGGLDVLRNILAQQGMLNEAGEMTGTKPSGRGGGRGGAPAVNTHPVVSKYGITPPSGDDNE